MLKHPTATCHNAPAEGRAVTESIVAKMLRHSAWPVHLQLSPAITWRPLLKTGIHGHG
jgi:hypothetical protein